MMSRMSQLNFRACATVGRVGARKYLFLARMWALLRLGRIVMAGGVGVGGGAAWEPEWDSILGLGGYNPDTANKGGYGGKVTGIPRRRVKESSAGQRARRMAGGDKATLTAEILRQQDETWRRMGEPEEELRTTVGAVEATVCSNPVLTNSNSFLRRSNETERPPARFSFKRD